MLERLVVLAVAGAVGVIGSPAAADVGVDKVTSNVTPTAGGGAFTYTITLTNNDAVNPAVDVVMTDPLPPSVLFESVAVAGANKGSWSCTGPAVGTNGLVECTAASFPASGSAIVTIVAKIAANVASGVRTNTARVVAGGVENMDSVQQNIVVSAPLSVSMTATATAARGEHVTYLITLNNGGSSTTLNSVVTDQLPVDTSFVSLVGTGAFFDSCSVTPANLVNCFADVPSGVHYLTLTAKTSPNVAVGNLANTVTITSAGTGTIATGSANASTNITP